MVNKGKEANVRRSIVLASIEEFLDEFKDETDRAAVIVGAAKLDLIMHQILQRLLLPNPSGTDDLLEGDSPLATLNAKIHMLYRLGIIDASLARLLHLTRRIRNDFAHETTGLDLGSGAHRNRVRELVAPLEKHEWFEKIQDRYFADSKGPSTDFRTVLAILVVRLEGICERAQTFPSSPTPLIPNIPSTTKISKSGKPQNKKGL